MRATIVLAGSLLFVSSALAADSTILLAVANVSSSQAAGTVEMNAARVAAIETQVSEGSLENFGATGLPQLAVAVKVSANQAVRNAAKVSKEAQISEGSLEKFNATGLAQ